MESRQENYHNVSPPEVEVLTRRLLSPFVAPSVVSESKNGEVHDGVVDEGMMKIADLALHAILPLLFYFMLGIYLC